MKLGWIAVVIALGLAAAFVPASGSPTAGEAPGLESPPVAVCPLIEVGDRSTRVHVVSLVEGDGRMIAFSAGSILGESEFSIATDGSASVAARDSGAIASSGGLLEFPDVSSAAAVRVEGETSRAAESCVGAPTERALLGGGATSDVSGFEVLLVNPYSAEAVADLTVVSESGLESDSRFEGIIVPPSSTRTIDMGVIVPGRDQLSVTVETRRGALIGYGLIRSEGQQALWRAVAPAQDWWLPVPAGEGSKLITISSSLAADLEYQVDVYGPEGFQEGFATGILAPRGQFQLDLGELSGEAMAVRVSASAPVVTTLFTRSNGGYGVTPGSPVDALTWLLPAAGATAGGAGQLVLLNSGVDAVDVEVRALSQGASAETLQLEAEQVAVLPMAEVTGYRVDASGPLVALWFDEVPGDSALAIGTPLDDG